jgi:gamma-glutamylcysteine synthetase
MIVSMNERNSDGYIALFTEAYNYLRDLDKGYVDENKERFGSLAEYYSHMADFFENQKYKYVMLPIEEEPFKIDLNTRNIEIP